MKAAIITVILLLPLRIFYAVDGPITGEIASNTCLPENEENEEVLEMAITDLNLAIIWTESNIKGVTTENVSYVLKNDMKCDELLVKYDFWINEKYENSNVNVHMLTFHKHKNYYFVIMQYNNSQEYITFGTTALYILDEDLEDIAGYGF